MPSASDYGQLGGVPLQIRGVDWGAEVLSAKYGGGYFDQALVGPSRGLHKWKVVIEVAPDTTTTSLGTITGLSPFEYYYQFFKSHTVSTVPFIIAWNGKTWTAKFSDPRISFDRFKALIYSTGVPVEQISIRGFLSYAADGSIAP